MNEVMKITINENQEPVISGRELHAFLEVKTVYKDWFPRMCDYGFEEGTDFCSILSKSTGGRPSTDHAIKLDMAKELAMIQRTERGKQARQYFIQVEKDYNSPEKIMARALHIANKELESLKLESKVKDERITELTPKALFADAVSASNTSILVGEMAKLLKQNGVEIGQRRLFEKLRSEGFLMKNGSSKNMPTQRAMDLGLFEIKEGSYIDSQGNNVVTRTVKVTGKGQVYFVNRYLRNNTELPIIQQA